MALGLARRGLGNRVGRRCAQVPRARTVPRLGGGLYIALGWAGVFAAPAFLHRPLLGLLFLLGGILYTVGAALFASRRPRLNPAWFGYHEAWHTFVVAAGALMFAGNYMLVRSA